jgi:hypothetical protein
MKLGGRPQRPGPSNVALERYAGVRPKRDVGASGTPDGGFEHDDWRSHGADRRAWMWAGRAQEESIGTGVRRMARKNPTWVGRRTQAELRFLGCEVSPPSPSPNTCDGPSGPPSPTWRASLAAHRREIAAVDFFVVPTLAFRPLFGFVILRHDRRELLHIGVTDQPTPRGRPNRSSTRSRTRLAPLTCSPIAMPSTAPTSSAGSSAWAFARSSLHLALPGRIPSPSASSARFAANASISSSCSTNATRVACFARTSATTTLRGLTRVSVATAHAGARYSRSHPGVSSQSPRSAGFITATSARASSPLPARRLTARRPRLPVPLRSSVQAGLSWVDTVIWRCSQGRRPCRFRREPSQSLCETLRLGGSPFRPGQGFLVAFEREHQRQAFAESSHVSHGLQTTLFIGWTKVQYPNGVASTRVGTVKQ